MGRKRASEDWLLEDEIPSADDIRWERWSAVITSNLTQPRSAKELAALLPQFSFPLITNILCWMDVRGRVERDISKRPVLWWLKPPASPARERPTACGVCGGPWTVTVAGVTCLMCGRPWL